MLTASKFIVEKPATIGFRQSPVPQTTLRRADQGYHTQTNEFQTTDGGAQLAGESNQNYLRPFIAVLIRISNAFANQIRFL